MVLVRIGLLRNISVSPWQGKWCILNLYTAEPVPGRDRELKMRPLVVAGAALMCASTFLSPASAQQEAVVIWSMPASEFGLVDAAFQDFFLERSDRDCFDIFVSESEEGVHVMFLLSDRQPGQRDDQGESNNREDWACRPGARYDYDHDGQLLRKTYIR
jgi:hypothetical protein